MPKKILVISPHTDDGELGCGGSIAKFIEEGDKVDYVALSCCEKSIPPEYPPGYPVPRSKRCHPDPGDTQPHLIQF